MLKVVGDALDITKDNKTIIYLQDGVLKALKEEGANVKGMVAIFNYGFDIAAENFKNADVKLTTLSDYDHLLEQSLDSKYISEKELETLKNWRENPSEWNQ